MTLDEFRGQMNSYRQSFAEEARSSKNSHIVLSRFRVLYGTFDAGERELADQVLCEWLLSDDKDLRFDARALVNDLKIVAALPALRKLANRLAANPTASAADERETVQGIIGRVEGKQTDSAA